MREVVVRAPRRVETAAGRSTLTADVLMPGGPRSLWFEGPSDRIGSTVADAFALATLLPAARVAERLVVEAPVSTGMAHALNEVMGLCSAWFEGLKVIDLALDAVEVKSEGRDTAAFFSGGVDSFYTATTLADEIDLLLHVEALDIITSSEELRSAVVTHVEAAARELGMLLVRLRSNVRAFAAEASWAEEFHGIALACVAHAMSDVLSRAVMGGDRTYHDLFPWGAHPLLMQLCSTPSVSIQPHAWPVPRVDRVEDISRSDVALAHLRVCWRNPGGAYNCGVCEKCLRTMAALELAGALGRAQTFPGEIDMRALRRVQLDRSTIEYWRDTRARAAAKGHRRLARIVGRVVRRTEDDLAAQTADEAFAGLGSPAARRRFASAHRDDLYRALSEANGSWLLWRTLAELPRKLLRKLAYPFRRVAARRRMRKSSGS